MATIRTFIAAEMPQSVRSRGLDLIERLRPAGADVKWTAADQMHLTLKFLGDVPATDVPGVCDAVADAASGIEPFEIECGGAGAFPSASRPRTLWLGLTDGHEPMAALHKAVETALADLGFRPEHRRFHGHLTLGRVRQGKRGIAELSQLIEQNSDFPAGAASISELVIFSSELTRQGPIYTVLGRAPLGG